MQITIQRCPSDLSIYTVKDLKKSSPLSVQPLCNYLSQYQANSLERLLATSLKECLHCSACSNYARQSVPRCAGGICQLHHGHVESLQGILPDVPGGEHH
mmetsp:Transcript_21419/g.44817  ORF Transcript_21419/g.44817 Transcript_21419/m.44817 type:complete len:100 (+) Transcript_21419:86-385(+)